MKIKKFFFAAICCATLTAFADNFTGLWTTIDDETKEQKSVVQIYKHENMYFGRIIHLFKNPDATAKLPNNPKILGLDIIWNMKQAKEKLNGGKILDPKKGSVYSCEMWRDGENLIVRGKIAFLGRNQTWIPYKGDEVSAQESLTPSIPEK